MVTRTAGERVSLLAKGAVGVGVVLVLCTGRAEKLPDTTVVGAVAVGAVILGLAYIAVERATDGPGNARSAAGTAASVALFLGVLLTLAAGAGFGARYMMPFEYAEHWGERTTATRPDSCTTWEKDYGGARGADRTECPDATWQADGAVRTGTLIVSWEAYAEPGREERVPTEIEVNAVGDRAYSVPPEKNRTWVAAWGGVPLWVLGIGLPLAAVGLLVLHRLGRLRRTR